MVFCTVAATALIAITVAAWYYNSAEQQGEFHE